MKHLSTMIFSLFIALLLVADSFALIEAITKPDADILLSFVRGGRVSNVLVTEGQRVNAGQLLAKLEDTAERLQLQQLKEKAADKIRINMVDIELAQKQEDLQKMEAAKLDGAITMMEVEHARLEVETSRLSKQMAEFERKQLGLQRDELEARVKQLSLKSPISGQVEEIVIEVGEAAEPLSPVIRIVKIDPLLIDAQVPLNQAKTLVNKQVVRIPFPEGAIMDGVVQNVSAVADAASDTLRVRIKVNNKERRPAGERVQLQFQ